jgi:hypothetical protein
MSDWIQKHWNDTVVDGLPARQAMIRNARGILIDARRVPAPTDEPIFMERERESVFVE